MQRILIRDGLPVRVALLLAMASPAWSQPPGPPAKVGAREQVVRAFNAGSPAPGQVLPDLSLLDHQGQPFGLSQLKGNFTVIVFGCLT